MRLMTLVSDEYDDEPNESQSQAGAIAVVVIMNHKKEEIEIIVMLLSETLDCRLSCFVGL